MPLIQPPRRVSFLLKLGVAAAERVAGGTLLPARLLAWTPRAAVGAGVMEALVAHDVPSARILRLVRLTVSFTVDCGFCIDLNAHDRERQGVTDAELAALRRLAASAPNGLAELGEELPSLGYHERLAVAYAHRTSLTPPDLPGWFTDSLLGAFDERELVTLASTIAQVNFWARFSRALGVPPAGFTDVCARP